MSKRRPAVLPVALSRARRRFEQWRGRHRSRKRLPDEFWDEAAKLAREHGLNKTARALRLGYYSLKKRIDSADDSGRAAADFIEMFPAEMTAGSECTIELEEGDGAKMRIHLKGAVLPDLAALTRVFRKGEA